MARPTNFTTRLGAVVLTYVTHYWIMAGIAAWFILVLAPQLILAASRDTNWTKAGPLVSMMVGFPLLFAPLLIAPQAKAQFGHPRAALTPGFAGPHLILLTAILTLLTLIIPWIAAVAANCSPLGMIALALTILAPTLLAAHHNRMLGMVIGLGAFYSTMTSWGAKWWLNPEVGYELVHAVIVVAGIAIIGAWLYRLAHLREEMDDYQSFTMWPQSRKAGAEVSEQRRAVAANLRRQPLMAWLTDERLKQIGGFHGHRLLPLARLLKFGFQQQAFVQGLWMAVWFGGITLFLGKFTSYNSAMFGPSTFYLLAAMMFPGMFCGEWLAHRRPRIAAEMLLPLSRSQYVDGLLTAAIQNAVTFWLVMNFGLAVVTYAAVGAQLTLPALATMLLISASSAIGIAGISLRTAVWPSLLKRLAVLSSLMIVFQAPITIWARGHAQYGNGVFLPVAIATTTLGLIMLRFARQAWLNLEIG